MKKVLLIILDGFGLNANRQFNAVKLANMPNWELYTKNYAFGAIEASGNKVGLPSGQFGNSEVGHLNIGSGRIVAQDITRIDLAIEDKSLAKIKALQDLTLNTKNRNLHILGLLSDGGVHSHINHIIALIEFAASVNQFNNIFLHLFLDGRDTPPKSAIKYLNMLEPYLKKYPKVQIVTLSGRYYAMDRDKRYDRIKLSFDVITLGNSLPQSINNLSQNLDSDIIKAKAIIENSYSQGLTDEFIKPQIVHSNYTGINDCDDVIFANYRSDRAYQLTNAFLDEDFTEFKRERFKVNSFLTMTEYDPKFKVARVIFPRNLINNTLGEYISNLGLKQLRIAETEKYPHVTYFFSGGRKDPFEGEKRILIDSPKDVATYDLKPQMSLPELTNKLVECIKSDKYDLIITNFANGDMVGHTGNLEATIKAVEAIDEALGSCVESMRERGGEVLVIADHGNCELMFDEVNDQPHTQHTTNLVPCLYIGRKALIPNTGSLQDVAPSILAIMDLPKPIEMTGNNLIKFI